MRNTTSILALSLMLSLAACRGGGGGGPTGSSSPTPPASSPGAAAPGHDSVDGITIPAGFKISVFADGVGPARHMVARPDGSVYVRLSGAREGKCMVALRDGDGDGKADETRYFGDSGECGTGMALDQNNLYYSTATEVWRQPLDVNLVPAAAPVRVARDLGTEPMHDARSLTLDTQGNLYVNIGAPSNACQIPDRTPGVRGQDPCQLLNTHGGIWRFSAAGRDQAKAGALRYATGIRNAVALDWNRSANKLYLLQHGRDQLDSMWPALFSAQQNTDLPAEEFVDMAQGDNLGWPYCYYDPFKNQKLLAPEYGGNGSTLGRCNQYKKPLIGFPAHYAPNDLIFYAGNKFPAEYRNGAFIAFHGSWNRNGKQEGYNVVHVPFSNGAPGQWRVFAEGFAGGPIATSGEAKYRPVGLAELPDGNLLVVDSKEGRIWKISH